MAKEFTLDDGSERIEAFFKSKDDAIGAVTMLRENEALDIVLNYRPFKGRGYRVVVKPVHHITGRPYKRFHVFDAAYVLGALTAWRIAAEGSLTAWRIAAEGSLTAWRIAAEGS